MSFTSSARRTHQAAVLSGAIVVVMAVSTTPASTAAATPSDLRAMHRPAGRYLADAAHWADGYLRHDTGDTGDTFNLQDDSALADTELIRATSRNPRTAASTYG